MKLRIVDQLDYESFDKMCHRMNMFVSSSGLVVASIETVSVEGNRIDNHVKEGHYISRGKRSWPVFQILRVWYNAHDPANMSRHVQSAIYTQDRLTREPLQSVGANNC